MKLLRKRVLIPAALLLTAGLLLLTLVLRGTLARTDTPQPVDGPLAHLWLQPDGRKVVRAAIVVERPAARVWGLLTDYARFPEVFPSVSKAASTVEPDGRHRLQASVSASILGTWDVDVRIRHEDGRVASWDQPGGDILRNRGSWTLTKLDENRTLVEYLLDVEIANYPDWFVRAILRGRAKGILRALDEAARK